jgi:hypothetical protein
VTSAHFLIPFWQTNSGQTRGAIKSESPRHPPFTLRRATQAPPQIYFLLPTVQSLAQRPRSRLAASLAKRLRPLPGATPKRPPRRRGAPRSQIYCLLSTYHFLAQPPRPKSTIFPLLSRAAPGAGNRCRAAQGRRDFPCPLAFQGRVRGGETPKSSCKTVENGGCHRSSPFPYQQPFYHRY